MTTPTTEKPLTDWNAWLGEVPPEKRHVGCLACAGGRPFQPGSIQRSICGVPFVARGGKAEGVKPDHCDDCVRMWNAPCSPTCPRNRKP